MKQKRLSVQVANWEFEYNAHCHTLNINSTFSIRSLAQFHAFLSRFSPVLQTKTEKVVQNSLSPQPCTAASGEARKIWEGYRKIITHDIKLNNIY